jgi:hypothetical protein
MIPARRERFNREFSLLRYRNFTRAVGKRTGVDIEFRLSETPCFFPASLLDRLVEVSHELIGQLLGNPAYLRAADEIVPPAFRVASGETRPTFLCIDFGLVKTDTGFEGRLVELQAFASLYGFQMALAETAIETYALNDLGMFLGDLTREQYVAAVGRAILNGHDPAQVVLMEIDPARQKTRPDFEVTAELWGVRAIDIRAITKRGRKLFYRRDGVETPIARIYNRVIPDELTKSGRTLPFSYQDEIDVEWAGGPDWFFRISKFSIPWLRHPCVPLTHYLSNIGGLPPDREEWLIKPLFSFAGGGIIFAPTDRDFAKIPQDARAQYVLQRRVAFTPVIDTPYGPTQAEIRIMCVRDGDTYRAVMPLVRMGRGKMMGVDYNKGLDWVGASAALIERD